MLFVKPTEGLRVPDPERQGEPPEIYFLPPEGRHVPDDFGAIGLYWRRRIKDGEVTVVDPPPAIGENPAAT
jgi:hypothetical protein